MLRRDREERVTDGVYFWFIFLRETGEFIGWVDVSRMTPGRRAMANLGYFIVNNHRGKGYAVEGVKRVVPVAFNFLRFHRLEAAIDPTNRASIRVVKKAGLHREGIRKYYWFQNGRWEDQVSWIATPELWRARGKKPRGALT